MRSTNIQILFLLLYRMAVRGIPVAICVGAILVGGKAGWAEQREGGMLEFNIDGQPLVSALDAYSAVTGIQIVYDAALASNRRSQPVQGSMTADIALRQLLAGAGLVASYASPTVFTLVPATVTHQEKKRSLADFMPYLASIQGRMADVFCRSPLAMPGAYQIKVKFRIGASGAVLQPQLMGSTGNDARNEAIAGLLKGLVIDRPPPPDMPQPVIMAILPRPPAETGDCGAISPGAAPR